MIWKYFSLSVSHQIPSRAFQALLKSKIKFQGFSRTSRSSTNPTIHSYAQELNCFNRVNLLTIKMVGRAGRSITQPHTQTLVTIDCAQLPIRTKPSSNRTKISTHTFINWKCYYDQKITSFFSSDLESVISWRLTGKILNFDFYQKPVYFECKFWISRSAITHVPKWPIGVDFRESLTNLLKISARKRSLLYLQNTSLKVWKPEIPVLHIN